MAPKEEHHDYKIIDAARPTSKHRKNFWIDLIASLREDQAIECENILHKSELYRAAKYSGMQIQTQKQDDGKLRIWRVK